MSVYTTELTQQHGLIYYTFLSFFLCVSFHYVWSRENILDKKGYLQRRKKEYLCVQGKVIFGLRSLCVAA